MTQTGRADVLPTERLDHACSMGLLGRNRESAEDVVITRARVAPAGPGQVPQLHLSLRGAETGKAREVRISNVAWISSGDGPRLAPVDYLLGARPVLVTISRDDFVVVARLRPVRVPAHDVSWASGDHVEGWRFGVRKAMAPALDVEPLPDGTWETFKVPCHAFAAGDMFFSPAGIQDLPWDEMQARMKAFAHVLEAEPDGRDDETGAAAGGWVSLLTGPSPSEPGRCLTLTLSQADFRRYLKEGLLPAPAAA